MSFLKRGAASKKLAEQEAVLVEQRKQEMGKPFRFYLGKGEKAHITFVDGELDDEGVLTPPRLYEHNLKINGTWGHTFVCPALSEPEANHVCPICETGNKPSLKSMFTIVDHRAIPSKDGTKVYKDRRKLFLATNTTYELLYHAAQKRGGLAGATFEVLRSNEQKSASVGTAFDFEEKRNPEELKGVWVSRYQKDGVDVEDDQFTVIDYETAFNVYTPEELRAMPMFGGTGASTASTDNAINTSTEQFKSQL